jgi:hypothetical protein
VSRTVSLVDSVFDRVAVMVAREPMLALFPTSLGVDIFNMEIESFLESESQGVDDREEAEHRRLFDQLGKRVNFAD